VGDLLSCLRPESVPMVALISVLCGSLSQADAITCFDI